MNAPWKERPASRLKRRLRALTAATGLRKVFVLTRRSLNGHPVVARMRLAWMRAERDLRRRLSASEEDLNSKILEDALSFQGDLVHLLEEPLPRGLRGTIYYFASLIFIALLVSIFFKVDIIAQGFGKLTYDGPPIVLQPFESTVLRSLLVRPGDVVKKGQTLATLDPTFSEADLGALDARMKAVRSQVSRLEAEASGAVYTPNSVDGDAGSLQLQIFSQRSTEYNARLRAFDEMSGETSAGLARTEADIKNLDEQLKISRSIEKMQEKLFKFNTNSQLEFLNAQNNRLRAEREFQEATDRLVELQHHYETVQAQKDGYVQEWRRNLLEELNRQKAERAQIEASLTKSSRVNSMIVISAPEDGVVLDIANRSVGSVLRGAEPLVILIPTTVPLISEIQLGSASVGETSVGDDVLIKVDAFPFQKFGGLKGKIRSISFESHSGSASSDMESVANKRAASGGFHRVAIELQDTRLPRLPKNRVLFPGMTVTAEIHLGKRRLIQYLLNPILRGFQESFREP
jgi:hemolysin D